jgi:Purple acid Phosphatase, N-terminal domain
MTKSLFILAITVTLSIGFFYVEGFTQELPPQNKAAHVEITQGPSLEMAIDGLSIIRWTSTNPAGSDDHFGVVHYGTDPKNLSETARSHIRLNRNHPYTVFRVRLTGLKPKTTYYYTVDSIGSGGKSDGAASAINQFTTPNPGERFVADAPRSAS